MFNEYFSEKLQKQEENEVKQINSEYKSRKEMRKEAKEAKEAAKKEAKEAKESTKKEKQIRFDLIDPQESLSNTGVNMGGGGSIFDNLMNIIAPIGSTPDRDPITGGLIYG